MLNVATNDEQFRIIIHHIGGIGESGPVEALEELGHVEWVIYDAQAESLSSVHLPGNRYRLVRRVIGGMDSSATFYVTEWPSASSLLRPSSGAEKYTLILRDNRAQIWGQHTKIVKSIGVQVNSLDSLTLSNEVPQPDFLSMDAQGAELSILDGASSLLKDRIIGVLCEVEFTELYERQPLFCDVQDRLRKDRFRLCEIYNHQYFNTVPMPPELRSKGFLTFGEALFLRDATTWIGDKESKRSLSDREIIQIIKLAAVAVAFDQLDYAIEICRRLEDVSSVSLDALAAQTDIKYIKMLSDLRNATNSIMARYSPYLERTEQDLSMVRISHIAVSLRIAAELLRLTLLAIASKFSRRVLGKGFGRKYPLTSKILYKYGFEELAIKHAIRNAGIPYLSGGVATHYLDLIMVFLFRYL